MPEPALPVFHVHHPPTRTRHRVPAAHAKWWLALALTVYVAQLVAVIVWAVEL